MKQAFNQRYLISYILKSPLFSGGFSISGCVFYAIYTPFYISIEKLAKLLRKGVQSYWHNTLAYSIT